MELRSPNFSYPRNAEQTVRYSFLLSSSTGWEENRLMNDRKVEPIKQDFEVTFRFSASVLVLLNRWLQLVIRWSSVQENPNPNPQHHLGESDSSYLWRCCGCSGQRTGDKITIVLLKIISLAVLRRSSAERHRSHFRGESGELKLISWRLSSPKNYSGRVSSLSSDSFARVVCMQT